MTKPILMSYQGDFYKELKKLGFDTINTQKVDNFISFEQYHADMQCLIIEDTAFVLSCCDKTIKEISRYKNVVKCEHKSGKYPDNVLLNALVLDRRIICKESSLSNEVKEFCYERNYEIINVNQGYSACSCAIVDEHSIITADNSIYKILTDRGYEVLKIDEGHITLDSNHFGFIGGASAKIGDTLYFFGNIQEHPSYEDIKSFCENRNINVISLSNDTLTDIGGIKLILC